MDPTSSSRHSPSLAAILGEGALTGRGGSLRPAVEIIARLSAERARLRSELARLRQELRRAESRDGSSGLREELEKTRSERDALRERVATLERERRAPTSRSAAPDGLSDLVARLERCVGRIEEAGRGGARGRAPAPSEPAPERGRRRRQPPAPAGNGFMAALVAQNQALRGRDPAAEAPEPAAPAEASRPPNRLAAAGVLPGLVAENDRLRAGAEQRRRRRKRAQPAGGGPLAALVRHNLALRGAGEDDHHRARRS